MSQNRDKYIAMWYDNADSLRAIATHTVPAQPEYEQAISLCAELHCRLAECLEKDEYIQFLSVYADIISLDQANLDKEVDIQEEIVSIRRRQCDANWGEYKRKLSNSLRYAAELHRKAVNPHKAMECMEEHRNIEMKMTEEHPNVDTTNAILATYRLADLYASLGRNILAEDYYLEAVEMSDILMNKDKANIEQHSILSSAILIELAGFYINSNMLDNAIDRYVQAVDILRPYEKHNNDVALQIKSLYQQLYNIYTAVGNTQRANYYKQLIEQP